MKIKEELVEFLEEYKLLDQFIFHCKNHHESIGLRVDILSAFSWYDDRHIDWFQLSNLFAEQVGNWNEEEQKYVKYN
ncbi:MAG: hypothetical protein KAG37_05115 [Flavobacteriales bacterium]|nr:hypothetical protein [Flavobacteriales bacterium]